jgi:hypothetical protein
MKSLLRLALFALVMGAAACSSPVSPGAAGPPVRRDESPVAPADESAPATPASDSTAARNGGNLMGGH